MEEKDDELQTNLGATRSSIWGLALVGTGQHWFLIFSTKRAGISKQIQRKFCKLPPFLSWIRVSGWKYLDMDKYGWLLDIPDNTDSTNIVHTTT